MKHNLLFSTILAGLASSLGANIAHAQSNDTRDSSSEAQKEDKDFNVIVVTGSRIGRSAEDVSAPLSTVTSEDFRRRGHTSVLDALKELAIIPPGSGIDGAFGASDPSTAGVNTVDLRGLSSTAGAGASRTLTLINGRRHVAGVGGTSSVDVATIPAALVDRVEIVTGGSSAVYGSEAIAGVVNILLKKDFEGLELTSQYGITDRGDGEEFQGSLAWGTNIGDRANLSVGLQYNHQSRALISNRRFLDSANLSLVASRIDIVDPKTFKSVTIPAIFKDVRDGTITSGGLPISSGRFLRNPAGMPLQFGPGGTLVPFDIGTPVDPATPTDPFYAFPTVPQTVGGDGLPFGLDHAGSQISSPSKRYLGYANFNYELSDATNFFAEAKFSHSESSFVGPLPRLLNATIRADNPFLDPAAAAIVGAAIRPVVNRQFDELAPVSGSAKNDTFRIVAGFNGRITDNLNWVLSANYGRSERDASALDYNLARLAQAADVTTTGGGNPACRNPANGCVPINILGSNQMFSQAALDFFTLRPTANTVTEQFVIAGSADGSLLELPSGPMKFAAGVEFRTDSLGFNPDALARMPGGIALSNLVPSSGSINIFELFGELNIPVLEDRPGIENLNLDISARYGSYNTVGGTFSWKVGATYSPIPGMNFRGTYGTAVRAPNINEAFGPESNSVSFIPDLCSAQSRFANPNRTANCANIPLTIPPFVPIALNRISNPNLGKETADTWTLGVDYSPEFIPGFTLSANYFSIDISDAIDRVTGFRVQELCYDTDPAISPVAACNQITRDQVRSSITAIIEQYDNISSLKTTGFDLSALYNTYIASIGQLSLSVSATILDSYDAGDPFNTGIQRLAGRTGHPRLGLTGNIGFNSGDFGGFVNVRHQGGFVDDDVSGGTLEIPVNGVTYVDASVNWTLNDRYTLTIGASNLFDVRPPTTIRVLHSAFDVIGRRYFASLAAKIF